MLSHEISKRLESMERRCDGMDVLAQLLVSQANRQRKELSDMRARLSDNSSSLEVNASGTIHAPSLAEMLRTRPT